jgi:protein-tyrosine phosphatase
MAEALLRHIFAERSGRFPRGQRGRSYRVESAGTAVMREGDVNPLAVQVMAEIGMDISSHRSRPLSMDMIAAADHIYTMTEHHRQTILEMVPEAKDRVEPLDPEDDVLDPAGADVLAYRECREQIEALIERVAVKL